MSVDPREELINVKELARKLRVPISWIYERTRPGWRGERMPFYRLGKYVRFRYEEVLAWLKKEDSNFPT